MKILLASRLEAILKKEELPVKQIERILNETFGKIPPAGLLCKASDIQESFKAICKAGEK